MTRTEYLQLKMKLQKLKSQTLDFQGGFEPFREEGLHLKWTKYQALSDEQKLKLEHQWSAYYLAVQNGYSGQKLKEASVLMRSGKKAELLALVSEVKAHPFEISKPSSIDPDELKRKMGPYFEALGTIKKWEGLIEQYVPVYEGKKSQVAMDL